MAEADYRYLLVTALEGSTVSYRPRFLASRYNSSAKFADNKSKKERRIRNLQYVPRRRIQ